MKKINILYEKRKRRGKERKTLAFLSKLFASFLIFSIIISAFATPVLGFYFSGNSSPKGIRLNLLEKSGKFIVVTSWYTESKATGPKVEYWEKDSSKNPKEFKATEKYINGYYFYSAELLDLNYNTKYDYRVYSNDYVRSETISFTTLQKDPEHLKILIISDSHSTFKSKDINKNLFNFIEKNEDDLDFFIHCGDVVSTLDDQSQWNRYFNFSEEILSDTFGLYVEGNHDYRQGKGRTYKRINLNGDFYSIEFGNLLSISILSTERNIEDDWIRNELSETHDEISWNIAFMHRPVLNSNIKRPNRNVEWLQYFLEFNVDFIFSGHNHWYERMNISNTYQISCPSSGGKLKNSGNYAATKYSEYFNNTYGYISVELDKNKLEMNVYGYNEDDNQCYLFDKLTVIEN